MLSGIACGGGAGRALAEWVIEGEPSMDLWPVDIRRFTKVQILSGPYVSALRKHFHCTMQ
ncbi:MAG: hypothetical protein CM1200mP30_06630 [Pseudomonadota bacterium]|nr:MAG: hypothetical protein CM1200mP30_06630 [Pseudomonadota bacterium]